MPFPTSLLSPRVLGYRKRRKLCPIQKKIQNVLSAPPHRDSVFDMQEQKIKQPPLASSNTKCTGIRTLGRQTPLGLSPS